MKTHFVLNFFFRRFLYFSIVSFFVATSGFNISTPWSYHSSLSVSFAAENFDSTQQELAAVGTAIEEINSWLANANSRQSGEEKALQNAELEIAIVSQSLIADQTTLEDTESQLRSLRARNSILETQKTAQSQLLAQTIRAAYMAGDPSTIKLLLNQQDVSESARMLHYHRLFSEYQIKNIETFQNTLDEIAEVNTRLEIKATELSAQQTTRNQQLLALNEAKTNREQALINLKASIVSRGSELEQLEIDQVELQQLIESINRAMERIPSLANAGPFNEQRGKLLPPADGPVITRFGSRYGAGSLTRQGITIGVSEGTAVQAVHAGRVVFADWLRGSGLLIIVDHGDGYMSLYGANQALSKQAGDLVNTGDILATSGIGGDQRTAGIYFEIRLHGEAQNPASWIQKEN